MSEDKAHRKDSCWFVGIVVDLGCHKWYQSRPLILRCGLGMNQAKAGGPVTSRARRVGSDRQCTRHGQGPEELGVIAGVQGTDKKRLLAKDLAEGHRDELTP